MSSSEREQLASCPMCGAVEGQNGVWLNPDGRYVACQACGVSTRDYTTNAEAIAAWNRRATAGTGEPVAWQEYAQHLEWCSTCAEDSVGSCHEGMRLKEAAIEAGTNGEAP